MIDSHDLSILRQYAALTGVTHIVYTGTGVRGQISHEGVTVDIDLDVLATGAVTMRCISGPDAGMSIEVSSIEELRQGLTSGAFEAVAANE